MKRLAILATVLIPALTMFAYYGDYGYSSRDDKMSGFAIFLWIVVFICSVILLIRWWKMTDDIKAIKNNVAGVNRDLAYLAAIGEKQKLEKVALVNIVDELYRIYRSRNIYPDRGQVAMDLAIKNAMKQTNILDIKLPDYVQSAKAFIDYMDRLNGDKPEEKQAESES